MKTRTYLAALAGVLLLATEGKVWAADNPALAFDNHGEITVGYRFADIHGYRPKFLELFNLKRGFRVDDVSLRGDARNRAQSFSDGYSLSASGLGGDPFATAQFKTGKTGVYDFRATWRQSYYYWNQNDDVALPISTAAANLGKGLTGNHDWATVRKLGSANLTVHATNALRFSFEIYRTTTDGALRTTRSLDFFNAPSFWGSFSRANPYPLDGPLADRTNRATGGVDYAWRKWNFHYTAGFQSFNENTSLAPIAPGEVSVNPVALSQTEPLNALSWTQTRRLRTPVNEFSFRGSPHSWLEWRGGYSYSRHRGPATLETAFSGIAPGSSGPLAPYSVSESGNVQVTESGHTIRQGFTLHLRGWWDLNADYRYSRSTSDSTAQTTSDFNGAVSMGTTEVVWENGIGDLDVNMAFTPTRTITIRPGIRLTKADIKMTEDGVVNAPRTRRVNRAQPEVRFSYRPTSTFSVRGDVTTGVTGASYTAMSARTRTAGHVIVRYRPWTNLSIENAVTVSSARILSNDYKNRVRANTTTVSYDWNDRIALFASLSYDSFYAQGDIVYARGSAPLTSLLRNQEIHRIWQGGVEVKPIHSIGARLSGNYDRLTGSGEITGEPAAYGPLRWPLITGTLFYDCAKVGRLALDLQRTYYIEELVRVNNFSANLLTLRYTRSF